MIEKKSGTENGYIVDNTSTNKELQDIFENYKKIRCIICNFNTSKMFKPSFLSSKSIITVNNKIPDSEIYINKIS